jgi:hypothetical protein
VSAPSPVMEATDGVDTYFYIHTLAAQDCGQFGLLAPERVVGRHPVQAGRLDGFCLRHDRSQTGRTYSPLGVQPQSFVSRLHSGIRSRSRNDGLG